MNDKIITNTDKTNLQLLLDKAIELREEGRAKQDQDILKEPVLYF